MIMDWIELIRWRKSLPIHNLTLYSNTNKDTHTHKYINMMMCKVLSRYLHSRYFQGCTVIAENVTGKYMGARSSTMINKGPTNATDSICTDTHLELFYDYFHPTPLAKYYNYIWLEYSTIFIKNASPIEYLY